MPKGVRRRYLALKLVSAHFVNQEDVMNAVWEAVVRLFGEYGASKADLALIKRIPEGDYMVMRCSHSTLEMVKTSIASVTEIGGSPAVVHILRVSGTLKALLKKLQL